MGLVNLQTNLKSLPFGNDQPGGGSSNQPYFTKPIPEDRTGFLIPDINVPGIAAQIPGTVINIPGTNIKIPGYKFKIPLLGSFSAPSKKIKITSAAKIEIPGINLNTEGFTIQTSILSNFVNSPDFLIRGGLLSFTNSAQDVYRLGQYFLDLKSPSGLLFVLKQNLLSRTAVRTEASGFLNEGVYLPTSTLAQAAVNAFGIHLNKQGVNPIPGVLGSIDTYEGSVNTQNLNRNRLVKLYKVKITGEERRERTNRILISRNDTEHLLEYPGGPGSFLGIGKTKIRFSDTVPLINNQGKDMTGNNSHTDRNNIKIVKPTGASNKYNLISDDEINDLDIPSTVNISSGSIYLYQTQQQTLPGKKGQIFVPGKPKKTFSSIVVNEQSKSSIIRPIGASDRYNIYGIFKDKIPKNEVTNQANDSSELNTYLGNVNWYYSLNENTSLEEDEGSGGGRSVPLID